MRCIALPLLPCHCLVISFISDDDDLIIISIQYYSLIKFRGFRPSGEMWSIDCGLHFFANRSIEFEYKLKTRQKKRRHKNGQTSTSPLCLARAWHHGSSLSLVFWVHRPTVKLCGLGSHHQKRRRAATSPQVWPAGPGLWTLARDLCQLLANIRDPISRERAGHRFTGMIWWLRTEDDLIATEGWCTCSIVYL